MKPAKQIFHRGLPLLLLILCASTAARSVPQVVTPATPKASTASAVDPARALWNNGDYSAAIAEFQKIIQQHPDDTSLHMAFVRTAANISLKESRLKLERDRAMAAQKTQKQEAVPEKKTEGAAPARGGPPVLTSEALAKMEADLKAAKAALVQLTQIYEGWAKANPKKAIYPYELAILTNRDEFDKRQQYLLKAVALDPKFTDAYQELYNLNSGMDDVAAAKYARKAAESEPDDFALKLTYASALWTIDQAGAQKYFRDLVARNAGTTNGSTALQRFISMTEDPKEQVALIEQFRREYPKVWTPGSYLNNTLYEQYLAADPAKGLAFAQEILKALGSATAAPNAKGLPNPAERNKTTWKANVDYAEALVQARTLIAAKKGADALALLEKTKVPRALEDSPQYTLLKAEAADAAGGPAKAYDVLAVELVKDLNEDYEKAIIGYGAKLGKSPKQVDAELWSRRMQKAEPFKEFDLARLDGTGRAKLSDFRGKVVLVDFWFPG
jgi:tetratricopeptide (TPR) repeat protein